MLGLAYESQVSPWLQCSIEGAPNRQYVTVQQSARLVSYKDLTYLYTQDEVSARERENAKISSQDRASGSGGNSTRTTNEKYHIYHQNRQHNPYRSSIHSCEERMQKTTRIHKKGNERKSLFSPQSLSSYTHVSLWTTKSRRDTPKFFSHFFREISHFFTPSVDYYMYDYIG